MLVLSRKPNERIVIADDIVVQILAVNGGRVRVGIDAPRDMLVLRDELEPHESVGSGATDGRAPMAHSA